MLKILRLLVTTSATFVPSLLGFPAAGIAQEYSGCFMVTSSSQIVNLNSICVNEKLVYQNNQLKPATARDRTEILDNEPTVRPEKKKKTIRPSEEPNNSNGKSVRPDGTIIYSNGIQVRSNGTVIYSDGTQARPDGTIIYPDGTQLGPND